MRGTDHSTRGLVSVGVAVAAALALGGFAEAQVTSRSLGARVSAASASEAATRFAAFTWSHNQPPASAHVSGLVHIHPTTNVAEAAARLRALPPGRRFVIIQGLSEDLAAHPADQCVQRTWKLVTRKSPCSEPDQCSSEACGCTPAEGIVEQKEPRFCAEACNGDGDRASRYGLAHGLPRSVDGQWPRCGPQQD